MAALKGTSLRSWTRLSAQRDPGELMCPSRDVGRLQELGYSRHLSNFVIGRHYLCFFHFMFYKSCWFWPRSATCGCRSQSSWSKARAQHHSLQVPQALIAALTVTSWGEKHWQKSLESRSKVVPEMKVSNIEPQMSQPLGPTIPKMFTYTRKNCLHKGQFTETKSPFHQWSLSGRNRFWHPLVIGKSLYFWEFWFRPKKYLKDFLLFLWCLIYGFVFGDFWLMCFKCF